MKKLLLLSLLLLTGCSVEYNAYIGETEINESIELGTLSIYNEWVPAYVDGQGASETNEKVEGVEYYDLKKGNVSTTLTYDFPLQKYVNSNAINTCLQSASISKVGTGRYMLNTTQYFSCMDYYPELTDININLTFADMFVITEHNADNINGNVLTWNVNESNYKNKHVQVMFETEKVLDQVVDDEDDEVEQEETAETGLVLLLGFLSLVIIVGMIIFMKKRHL